MYIKLKNKYLSVSGDVSYLIFELGYDFSFQEGQFAMLEKELHGTLTRRAYSIVSTNKDAKERKEIAFFVKRVSEMGMSDYLTKGIEIGDEIKLMGPFGHMKNDYTKNNYLLIAMGSGRASVLPILKNLLRETKNFKKIYTIFGERFVSNMVDKVKEIYDLDMPGYQGVVCFSKEDIPLDGFKSGNIKYRKGYVQIEMDRALTFLDTNDIRVFMCGKPSMVDELIELLVSKGVNKEDILFEKY